MMTQKMNGYVYLNWKDDEGEDCLPYNCLHCKHGKKNYESNNRYILCDKFNQKIMQFVENGQYWEWIYNPNETSSEYSQPEMFNPFVSCIEDEINLYQLNGEETLFQLKITNNEFNYEIYYKNKLIANLLLPTKKDEYIFSGKLIIPLGNTHIINGNFTDFQFEIQRLIEYYIQF